MAEPFEGFVRDRRWAVDLALTALVAVLTVTPLIGVGVPQYEAMFAMPLVLPLLFRRAMPTVALVLALVAGAMQVMYLRVPNLTIVAVPILVYSLARWSPQPRARLALGLGLMGAVLGPASWTLMDSGLYLESLTGFAMAAVACGGIVSGAYLVGRQRRNSAEQQVQDASVRAEKERLTSVAVEHRNQSVTMLERNRIARELHDIVAHSLSVIVVQAEGGRAVAAKKPELAAEVLGTIADTSRQALDEMRSMVGLLRGDQPESAAFVPTPGLEDIPELVRKTGDFATLAISGTPPRVSQALGLTAYRIVQESLTNVLKHGGPLAQARVGIGYYADSIELEIVDDGRGSAALSDGMGHGLQGMRERVSVHHGEVIAQPRPGGGFVVRASLPVSTEPTISTERPTSGSWLMDNLGGDSR